MDFIALSAEIVVSHKSQMVYNGTVTVVSHIEWKITSGHMLSRRTTVTMRSNCGCRVCMVIDDNDNEFFLLMPR